MPSDVEPIKKPEDYCQSELDSCCLDETSQELSFFHPFEKADVVSFIGSSITNTGIIFIGGIIASSKADLPIMMKTLQGL